MSQFRAPRGTQDVFGEEVLKWQYLEEKARDLCRRYHVSEMRTPIFEHTEVFDRGNDASDVVNKEMYSFEDRGGRSLTLKPEGTAGLIRAYTQHKLYAQGGGVQRYYYIAPNFRYERPQKGRMRIHHQFGVEFLGVESPYVDVEALLLGLDYLDSLGLKDYQVLINTLGDQESQEAYKKALRNHFKEDLPSLCEDCHRRYEQNPLRMLDCKKDQDHPAMKSAPENKDYLNESSQAYFEKVIKILDAEGIDYKIDTRLVRGLDYYHHTVFEVVSTDPKAGSQATLFAGGRYSHLVEYFGGPQESAVGFGMGLERLLLYLDMADLSPKFEESLDVYGMPLSAETEAMLFRLTHRLRQKGYAADLDMEGKSMRAQFKLADRFNAKVVAICGEDELKENKVSLKNQKTEEQVTVDFEDAISKIEEWIGE